MLQVAQLKSHVPQIMTVTTNRHAYRGAACQHAKAHAERVRSATSSVIERAATVRPAPPAIPRVSATNVRSQTDGQNGPATVL